LLKKIENANDTISAAAQYALVMKSNSEENNKLEKLT
jgi:hypothetical protein